ncbi:MAG: hypothetical protein VX498_14795 [Myxococcota bacterium]|nr:hypothetical protein [Myxococcota bacterium]
MLDLRTARRVRVSLTLLLTSSLLSSCCIPSLLGGKEASLYEAEVEDDETGSPRWYGLLAVETEAGSRYAKLGPYEGCSAGPAEDGLFTIECFWAGLMNTVRIREQGGSVVISNFIQDEGMEDSHEETLETIPLGGASVKAAGVQTLSFDELKAKGEAWGVVKASLPRPARPNPMTDGKFKYTSLKGSDCSDPEQEGDSFAMSCPAFGNYVPSVSMRSVDGFGDYAPGDPVATLSLQTPGGQEISFWDEINQQKVGPQPGVTEKLIEWRYRETGSNAEVHALIFRIYGKYPGKGKTKLMVARLEGDYGCIVGTTRSNKESRRIADNMNLRCSGPNTVATESGW